MTDENRGEIVPELIGGGEVINAQTRGEIDIQIATAKRYPRQISKVRENILELATADEETAESCFYALPRDGKVIEGPSVRFAEIIASSFQNLRVGTRIVSIDHSHVTVQGMAFDLENNNAAQVDVKRRITNKYGKRYSDDMIVTTANAASAIAYRNAIFKVVPRALFRKVEEKVRAVGMGDERTFLAKKVAAFEYFKGLGIDPDAVLAMIDKRSIDDVKVEDLRVLSGLRNALKEGTTTVEEAFGTPAEREKAAGEGLAAGKKGYGKKAEAGKLSESKAADEQEARQRDKLSAQLAEEAERNLAAEEAPATGEPSPEAPKPAEGDNQAPGAPEAPAEEKSSQGQAEAQGDPSEQGGAQAELIGLLDGMDPKEADYVLYQVGLIMSDGGSFDDESRRVVRETKDEKLIKAAINTAKAAQKKGGKGKGKAK